MTDFKELAALYELQAEAFSIHWEGYKNHMEALIVFAGIIVKMQSDIVEYELKNGISKTKEQNDRISQLKLVYRDLSGLTAHNEMLKLNMAKNNGRMMEMETELIELRNQLNAVEKAWKQ